MGEIKGRTFDLLTLGQLLLRLSPPDNDRLSRGDTFVKQVGGAELNVAVGASLLGLHTGVISKLPSHDIGSFMKGKIRSFGVSDDFFMYDHSPSARVGIYYYENGAYPRKPKVIYDRMNSFSLLWILMRSRRKYTQLPSVSIPPVLLWLLVRRSERLPLR